jgi:hypothetical protein
MKYSHTRFTHIHTCMCTHMYTHAHACMHAYTCIWTHVQCMGVLYVLYRPSNICLLCTLFWNKMGYICSRQFDWAVHINFSIHCSRWYAVWYFDLFIEILFSQQTGLIHFFINTGALIYFKNKFTMFIDNKLKIMRSDLVEVLVFCVVIPYNH